MIDKPLYAPCQKDISGRITGRRRTDVPRLAIDLSRRHEHKAFDASESRPDSALV